MSKLLVPVLTLLVCSGAGAPSARRQAGLNSLSDAQLEQLRDAGLPVIRDEIINAGSTLLHTATQVNETKPECVSIVDSHLQGDCKACVETKCQHKAESCSPTLWDIIFQEVEGFFSTQVNMMLTAFDAAAGLHDFVADAFNFQQFVDMGTGMFDTFVDVSNVFGEMASGAVNMGTSIWDGAQDMLGAMSEAFFGIGGSILGGFVDMGSSVISGFFNTMGGAIEGMGNLIGSLFDWRMRNAILQYHVRRRVRSEPTCDQLETEGGTACLQYASTCGNICNSKWLEQQYCTTFNSAMAAYQAAVLDSHWVTTLFSQNQNFVIDQVLVDGSSYDVAAGGYTSTTVIATLFGETYTFQLDSPLTMFDMTQAGQEIAQKALDHYKANHPPPTTRRN